MKSKIKKNLWWIISSIVLFVPIAGLISSSQYDLSIRLSLCSISFILLFLIMAMTGTIANKIKKVILKVLWIIFGLAIYAIGWLFTLVFIAMIEPLTEEEVNEFCQELPRYKRPRRLIFADIPRNPTGKIEKPVLRKRYGSDNLIADQNEIEN